MAFPISTSWAGATSNQLIASYDANWTVNRGTLRINTNTTNALMPDSAADSDAYRNDISDTTDAYAQGTWLLRSASNYLWVSVRLSTGATPNGYCVYAQGTTVQLVRMTSGGFTDLGSAGTIASGNTFRVEAQGTTIRGLVNGVQFASVTDSTYTTGRVGVGGYGYVGDAEAGMSAFSADVLGGAATSLVFRPGRSFGGLIVR
jgi:hypothetical protein